MQDEAPNADVEAGSNYLEDLAKIINEGAYTKQNIFNVRLGLDQHSLELCGPTHTHIFFPINILENFGGICSNLKK